MRSMHDNYVESVYQSFSALTLCFEANSCLALTSCIRLICRTSGTCVVPQEEGNLYTWEGGVQYLDESEKSHGNLCWKTNASLLLAEASLLGIEIEICMVQFFLTTQLLVDLTSH